MIFEISNTWRVKTIPMNFVLERKYTTKPSQKNPEGKESWEVVGYYANLKQALENLPDELILSHSGSEFDELMRELKTLSELLKGVINENHI